MQEQEKQTAKGRDLYEWVQSLVGSVLVVVAIFTFVIRMMGVDGHSMLNTLQHGDRLLVVNSMLYHDYKYGDIVILRKNGVFDDDPIVKRVIAVEGQTVDIDFTEGIVYVDGLSVGDTSKDVLDERTTLSNCGFACICAAVDHKRHQILGNVRVEMHGITGGDVAELRREASDGVKCTLRRSVERGVKGKDLEKACRDSLHSLLWDRTKQRPMVIATIIEV